MRPISWPQREESSLRYPVHPLYLPLHDYDHVRVHDGVHDRLLHRKRGMETDPRTYSRPRYLDDIKKKEKRE